MSKNWIFTFNMVLLITRKCMLRVSTSVLFIVMVFVYKDYAFSTTPYSLESGTFNMKSTFLVSIVRGCIVDLQDKRLHNYE